MSEVSFSDKPAEKLLLVFLINRTNKCIYLKAIGVNSAIILKRGGLGGDERTAF